MFLLLLTACNTKGVRENDPVQETSGLAQLAKTGIDNDIDILSLLENDAFGASVSGRAEH